MQGAQKLRGEAHLQVRRNDEVEAQCSNAADELFTRPSILLLAERSHWRQLKIASQPENLPPLLQKILSTFFGF
jgi:hypothetical protein